MNSEIKVYSYPNGEIQKVQVVRWDDWSRLDFLRPSYSPSSLKCFGDIYENFLVPARPEIFGQLVMVQLPEDMDAVWGSIRTYDDDWHKKYSGIVDTLTVVTVMLKKGVKLIGGKPRFLTEEGKCLWTELENRGCTSCGKHNCHSFHCPNCGFANSPELDQEFEFIIKLKDKLKNRKKASN